MTYIFIPDDVTFDDREPKSVAIENTIPVNFTPSKQELMSAA